MSYIILYAIILLTIEVISVKEARKNYIKTLVFFFAFTAIMLTLLGLSFLIPAGEYNTLIGIGIALIILIGMGAFRPRLMYYKEEVMFYKLKDNQDGRISTNLSPLSQAFFDKLLQKEFSINFQSQSFTIFTKYIKDKSQYHLKRPMLMVYVAIHHNDISYQDELFIKQINAIEDSFYKEKKRIFNYTVFVAKEGPTMSKNDQEECDKVSFSRVGKRSIVTINLFYETKKRSCYFLYSNKYSPTSYYNFGVQFLKENL